MFGRYIAVEPRVCTDCEEVIPEGTRFTKIANLVVCLDCEAYKLTRQREP